VNPLRSVGAKLALALLLVVAGALGIVYVIVVPFYERSLIDTRLRALDANLRTIITDTSPTYLSQSWVEQEAEPLANERVVVFELKNGRLQPVRDSSAPRGSSQDVFDDPIARRALEARPACALTAAPHEHPFQCIVTGTVTREGERYAQAAYPLTPLFVLLQSSPLRNDLESVSVVRQRVLVAGVIAAVFALVLGYALARLFARRIKRLDRAAARIADGEFGAPVVDPDPDELGQLARTFERMRVRLASLERARAEFIANASHELRTPLFSLAGFLELLASEELDADTRADFMAAIRSQVDRLTKLATDLLDLTRIDAGRLSVAAESLDLRPLGELLATEFGPRVSTSGHTLEVDVPENVLAFGDEERVLQIGRILIENAIVHTPPGTAIRVSASAGADAARFCVADDGPGIEPEAQSHVFERFYRLDGSVASGSGLGLAIASELAALMGGRLELESAFHSTRFTLVLPTEAADRTPRPELVPA
jgi:signal transduction histidine kinase